MSLLNDPGLVTSDSYHPHLSIDVLINHVHNKFNCELIGEFSQHAATLCFTQFYLRVIVQACMEGFYS
jgi:hypothetical protein